MKNARIYICLLAILPAFTASSVAAAQASWTYQFNAAKNATLTGWNAGAFQNGKVVQKSSDKYLMISSSTAAYNIKRQFNLDTDRGYTAAFKLALKLEGTIGNPNNAFVRIGNVQLYWVAPTNRDTSDGSVFLKLSDGSRPVARLGKTLDGAHVYWIARKGNKLRIWVDNIKDDSAIECKISSGKASKFFGLYDDNGASGKSKFQLYWLRCCDSGVVLPSNDERTGVDLSVKFDKKFGKKLVWKPWPLEGKIVLGSWNVFSERGHNANLKAMKLFKDAGFNICSVADKKAVDIGRKLGLHVLVMAQWGWQNRKDYFNGWVELAESYPDVGYLVWDEPEEKHFELLRNRLRKLNERDPSRLAWVNMLPYISWGGVYKQRVEKFIAMAYPRVISFDFYPLCIGGDEYVQYYQNMEIFRDLSGDFGIPWWAYVQTFGADHLGLRKPNESEMRWQVYSLLSYGARGIFYFLYPPFRGGSDGLIDKKGEPTEMYYQVQQMNREIKSMADVLTRVQSTAVMHIGRKKAYVKMFTPIPLVKKADAGNAILGIFENRKTGQKYIMVTNKDHGPDIKIGAKPQNISLTLGNNVKAVRRIGESKPEIKWSFNSDQKLLQLKIPPATGGLFEVIKE